MDIASFLNMKCKDSEGESSPNDLRAQIKVLEAHPHLGITPINELLDELLYLSDDKHELVAKVAEDDLIEKVIDDRNKLSKEGEAFIIFALEVSAKMRRQSGDMFELDDEVIELVLELAPKMAEAMDKGLEIASEDYGLFATVNEINNRVAELAKTLRKISYLRDLITTLAGLKVEVVGVRLRFDGGIDVAPKRRIKPFI